MSGWAVCATSRFEAISTCSTDSGCGGSTGSPSMLALEVDVCAPDAWARWDAGRARCLREPLQVSGSRKMKPARGSLGSFSAAWG